MHYLIISGNVGADAEVRTYNNQTVTNFRVAVNERFTDNSGVPKERTTWYSCSAWNVTYGPQILKGRRVMVMGIPQEHKPFQRQDGSWDVSNDVHVLFTEFQDANPMNQQTASMNQVPSGAQFSLQNSATKVDEYRMQQQQAAPAPVANNTQAMAMAQMAAAMAGNAQIPNQAPAAPAPAPQQALPEVQLPPNFAQMTAAAPTPQPAGENLPY